MIKGRVAIYQEDTTQQESYIEEMENYKFADSVEQLKQQMTQDMARPPLPAKIFAKELESTIDAKYHHGVYGTGKRVVGRLMAYYTKDRRDVECQTASMSEITGVFDRTIARLEEKLKQADEDLLRGNREQDRLGAKLRILGQENKSLTDNLTELQGEYEEMRRAS